MIILSTVTILVPVSKRVYVRNHSYENDFDLHENKTASSTHFNVKGFTLRLILKQRHMREFRNGLLIKNSAQQRRQCGQVVRAPDYKSRGHKFNLK